MKKVLYAICGSMLLATYALTAQVNIVVAPDSVFVSLPAIETEITLPSHITNNSGDSVTIRWTRVVEQETQGWEHAFCDKNLCYFGTVGSKTFKLANAEVGLLKPVFYPHEITGTGVMRLYYQSETPGVTWSQTAVYVAEGTELLDAVEATLVRDIAVFPNPAQDVLNVVAADANFRGEWRILDAMGKVWGASGSSDAPIGGPVSVAQLPAGFYFFKVLTADGKQGVTKPFIVQR